MMIIIYIALGILLGYLLIVFLPVIFELIVLSGKAIFWIFAALLLIGAVIGLILNFNAAVLENPLLWLFGPPLVLIGLYIGLAFLLEKKE